ncbi:MAG: acetyl-CoA carboxylase subunit beta [Clostridiales bacterium GWF2_36_10]|nr:MAG: acetyl-CoA carboxylase subunit beta [Clostridiales bacterium GWF2_36_10]HAN20227.1 acetyl-CoA carboxylase carboxyl transferase subunit beta [Clostridiales bacterium]
MFTKDLFKKPKNELESSSKDKKAPAVCIPEELCISCPSCKKPHFKTDVNESSGICPSCGHYFKIGARARIDIIADKKSFIEHDKKLTSTNIIAFPEYDDKIDKAKKESKESEAVITGVCSISGYACAIFVMEPRFIMGSMGRIVGEKITRLFEFATKKGLPVVGYTVSGGARMQEGILSLLQMAKVSGAVKNHSDAGNLYVTVLTNPTTGGVTASFAMLGDIIIAEPNALIGFAGPRVIEQTMRQKLPQNFQKAEYLLETGFIDGIVDRREQKEYLRKVLKIHGGKV